MGKVEAGIDCRAPRVSQWRWIIVTVHVAVDRQPVSQTGNAIRKIESRLAVSGIASIAKPTAGVTQTCQIPQQSVSRKRMAHTRPQRGAGEADLKVFCGTHTDFLQVEEG